MAVTGGCLCGDVRYEITGEIKWPGKCYCRDCQKESSSGHVSIVAVDASDIRLTKGALTTFITTGKSGQPVHRSFCPRCGTHVLGHPVVIGDMRTVRAGTLDDPSAVTMSMAIFVSQAQPWDLPPEGLLQFAEAPSGPPA